MGAIGGEFLAFNSAPFIPPFKYLNSPTWFWAQNASINFANHTVDASAIQIDIHIPLADKNGLMSE